MLSPFAGRPPASWVAGAEITAVVRCDGGIGLAWGLYVHIPFCPYKCAYCDFVAVPSGPRVSAWHAPYLRTLAGEARYWRHTLRPEEPPVSVFYGGGTPTVIDAESFARLHRALARVFAVPRTAEVTVECNPGTVDLPGLRLLREAGVNRLSIGLQAWQDTLLAALRRWHTRQQFLDAWGAARAAGFADVNVDLMFGLPGQRLADFQESLGAVVDLRPEHVSVYGLQVEEGTPFGASARRGILGLPAESEAAAMYQAARRTLRASGYDHYEISNFALPGRQCLHNRLYWDNAPYLGLGVGAASHWCGERWRNTDRLAVYGGEVAVGSAGWVAEREEADPARSRSEGAFLGLRLLEGLDLDVYRARYGHDLDQTHHAEVERLIARGLLAREGRRLRLSEQGLLLGNLVFSAFV